MAATIRLSQVMTVIKVFTCIWALITFAVAGALENMFDSRALGLYYNISAIGGIVAFGVLTFLYFLGFFIAQIVLGDHALISVMVDTIVLGVLFVVGLGVTATLSNDAGLFTTCAQQVVCQLGSATIGISWILVFLVLGILLGEVIHTLLHYGGSKDTWLTSFSGLLDNRDPKRSSRA